MHPIKVYGMTTVNEKGQIVIPADARRERGFEPGNRLVILAAPHGRGLIILKAEDVEKILGHMTNEMGIARE